MRTYARGEADNPIPTPKRKDWVEALCCKCCDKISRGETGSGCFRICQEFQYGIFGIPIPTESSNLTLEEKRQCRMSITFGYPSIFDSTLLGFVDGKKLGHDGKLEHVWLSKKQVEERFEWFDYNKRICDPCVEKLGKKGYLYSIPENDRDDILFAKCDGCGVRNNVDFGVYNQEILHITPENTKIIKNLGLFATNKQYNFKPTIEPNWFFKGARFCHACKDELTI